MKLTSPKFGDAEVENLRSCLNSGWVTQGSMTANFEQKVAERHRVKYALATTSCTAALHLAALALELDAGDEVIVPAFTWVTSANCAEYVGARVVFADIDPDTYNLDPAAFEAAITTRTRAVVVAHLFGLSAEMDAILAIAQARNISVIEDAACAIGTTYKDVPVGAFGKVGCFSFHPRKIVTTGEGGMVTTNDDTIARRIGSLRNHGASASPDGDKPWSMNRFEVLGYNFRLSDIQAAVGLAQMDRLDDLIAERRRAARRYNDLLQNVDGLILPMAGDAAGHTYQSYVVRLRSGGRERRNALMARLQERGIQTRPGTHAVHNLGYYQRKYDLRSEDFPVAANAEDSTVTLPMFPEMTEEDQELVASAILSAMRR